jgi:hypothetical protein
VRIVMRAGKAPHTVLPPEATGAFGRVGTFATNTGNQLFANAVYRHLNTPDTQILTDGMSLQQPGVTPADVERLNAEAHAVALPLANAFRPDFLEHLNRLADLVEQLTIPVTVIGVGGQAPLGVSLKDVNDEVNQATTRFVRAILDHSASIGVRGALTAQYLVDLGFPADQIDQIGCPSLYDYDARPAKAPVAPAAQASFAVTLTPTIAADARLLAQNRERYPDLLYIAQDYKDLRLLLWGEPVPSYPEGIPATPDHPVYQAGQMAMCLDPRTWYELLAQRDFGFGTRFHGIVAALNAGIPAMLLAHDSRTLELAEYHSIPYLPLDPAQDYDALALWEQTDMAPFHANLEAGRQAYIAFLERNGFAHTFAEPNPEYEEMLAGLEYPPPVFPLGTTAQTFAERLHWLWQGPGPDARRAARWHQPEFRVGTGEPPYRPVEAAIDRLTRLVEKQAETIKEQRKTIAALEHRVTNHHNLLTFRWLRLLRRKTK